MYCHCGPKFNVKTATKRLAPAGWQAKEVWICSDCEKISHAVQEAVPVIRGPKNATALLHSHGHRNGTWTLTWATPNGKVDTVEYLTYPRRNPMAETEPLLYLTWELLQSKVKIILAPVEGVADNDLVGSSREVAQHQARGIAEVLAIYMKPHVDNSNDVVRHAVAYYKNNDYEVPGLGLHLFDPFKNADGTPRTVVASPKTRTAVSASAPAKKLTEAEVKSIQEILSGGMMKADELSKMFNVPLVSILEISRG